MLPLDGFWLSYTKEEKKTDGEATRLNRSTRLDSWHLYGLHAQERWVLAAILPGAPGNADRRIVEQSMLPAVAVSNVLPLSHCGFHYFQGKRWKWQPASTWPCGCGCNPDLYGRRSCTWLSSDSLKPSSVSGEWLRKYILTHQCMERCSKSNC